MKKQEKIEFLYKNYPKLWKNALNKARDRADDETPIVCYCKRLATELHTDNCRKFRNKVETYAINELKYLLRK